MIKRFLKSIFAIGLVVLLVVASSVVTSAEVPYDSYTYWSDVGSENKAVYNRPMYSAETSIDALSLGIEPLSKINDITVDGNGNLFVLDNKKQRMKYKKANRIKA